jgi:hypothetical protein
MKETKDDTPTNYNDEDAQSQADNLKAFGFDTSIWKRTIVIGFIMVLTYALYHFTNEANERELDCKNNYNQLVKDYIDFTKEQINHRDLSIEKEKAIEFQQKIINTKIKKLKNDK